MTTPRCALAPYTNKKMDAKCGGQVWVIDATGEVFTDYEKYLNRYVFTISANTLRLLTDMQARFLPTGKPSPPPHPTRQPRTNF